MIIKIQPATPKLREIYFNWKNPTFPSNYNDKSMEQTHSYFIYGDLNKIKKLIYYAYGNF